MTAFKPGDRVSIVGKNKLDDLDATGLHGTIEYKSTQWNDAWSVNVDGHIGGRVFGTEQLTKLADTFKEGDKVKILRDNNAPEQYVGQVGKVTKVVPAREGINSLYYVVGFADGADWNYHHYDVEAAPNNGMDRAEIEYQGSDLFATAINHSQAVSNDLLVYCKRFAGECHDDQALMRKAITELTEGEWIVSGALASIGNKLLKANNTNACATPRPVLWWAIAAVLEHFWSEMFPPKETPVIYKPGDRVRVLDNQVTRSNFHDHFIGHVQVVAAIDPEGDGKIHCYAYPGNHNSGRNYYDPREIEPAEPYKAGDYVIPDGPRDDYVQRKIRSFEGLLCKIASLSTDGDATAIVEVVNPVGFDNHAFTQGRYKLFKLKPADPPPFKIGDRVLLDPRDEEPDPEYPGTVIKIGPDYVAVDWDRGRKGVVYQNGEDSEGKLVPAPEPTLEVPSTDVVVLVTFADDERRPPKAYEYLVERKFGVQPGDVLSVNTPYGNNKHITVQEVYEISERVYQGKLKRVSKRVRKGNPDKFAPTHSRAGVIKQEGRGLVGMDFAALEARVLATMPDGVGPYGAIDFKTTDPNGPSALEIGEHIHRTLEVFFNSVTNETQEVTVYKITKPTLVNGTDVKDLTDDNLIAMIDANAKALETLRTQNQRVQSKALDQRIARLEADTNELRQLLDSRYADDAPAAE